MNSLAKQCRNKAEEEGFASLMNDTKWRELCFTFAALERKPAWRTRDLLNGHVSDWDSDCFYHLGPDYCCIEWLEIDPRQCASEGVRGILQEVGATFEESIYFRVLGYRK